MKKHKKCLVLFHVVRDGRIGHELLEPISKFAFEPRDVIFMAKREVEGEEYRDISSPNRSVTAKNRVLCEPEWNFEIGSTY